MKKVSVITPIYNTEKYLERCLTSLINQTLKDIEFIWIDNGANDKCKKIISKYSKLRNDIRVIHISNNIGYSNAMNIGLDNATGEYVAFCDSDDWIDSNYFEELYLASKGQYDIVYTEYKLEYNNKSLNRKHIINKKKLTKLKNKIDALKDGAVWDKIFKKDFIDSNNIRFPNCNKSFYDDNIFLMNSIYNANEIILINNTFYHYFQSPKSTVHNKKLEKERINHLIKIIAFLINFGIDYNFSLNEKKALIKFINRNFSTKKILKNKNRYKELLSLLKYDNLILTNLKEDYKFYHPKFLNRIFSIQYNKNTNIKKLYILGFKIKL